MMLHLITYSLLLIGILAVGLLISAPTVGVPQVAHQPVQISSPTPSITLTPSIQTAGWSVYQDPTLGFSLQIPPDWYLYPAPTEGFAKTTILSNFDLEAAPPQEGEFADGQLKVSFSLSDSPLPEVQNLAVWIAENYLPPEATIVANSELQIGSYTGIRIDYDLQGQREIAIYVRLDTKLFFVHAVPIDSTTSELFEAILTTIEL